MLSWLRVPTAPEAPAFPLVLPEPCGYPGGNSVWTHFLEEQRYARRDTLCQFSCSSFCQGGSKMCFVMDLKMLWDPVKFEYMWKEQPTVYGSGRDQYKLYKQSIVSIYNLYIFPYKWYLINWCWVWSLFVSLQRCFTLMDRGFTFKLISNYINMITATDSKVTFHWNWFQGNRMDQ